MVFVLGVFIVPLVLLNLVIAIMGDTFDRAKEREASADFHWLVGLVYKYEIVAPCLCRCGCGCKKGKEWKYIFYSKEVKGEGEKGGEAWKGRVREIKMELKEMQRKNEEWWRNTEERERENEEKRQRAEKKNAEMLSKLAENSKKQDRELISLREVSIL